MRALHCAVIFCCLVAACSKGEPESHVFTTWATMEFDKCASAWIIVRYVDKDAQFKFFPKGSVIEEGSPFDVPGAELTRAHGLACAETVIRKYNITAPAAIKLARIAHEIEINPWAKHSRDAETLNRRIVAIMRKHRDDPAECLLACFKVFDEFFSGDGNE